MSVKSRNLKKLLSVAAIAVALPMHAASPTIVASVTVVTGNGQPQVAEYTIVVGRELSLHTGPRYRVTALPKEMDIARVLIEFKLIPVGQPGEQVKPPGTIEGSLEVGGDNQIILGPESPTQTDPQIRVLLRRK